MRVLGDLLQNRRASDAIRGQFGFSGPDASPRLSMASAELSDRVTVSIERGDAMALNW